MNRSLSIKSGVVALIIAASVFSSAFIVPEGLQATRLTAGKVSLWLAPGLHFRMPWTALQWRDQRIHLLAINGTAALPYLNVTTFDQTALSLGYAVLWQVKNPELYAKDFGTDAVAIAAIQTTLNQTLSQCCLSQTLAQWLNPKSLAIIVNQALASANERLQTQGIKLSQLMITAIEVPKSARDAWLVAMRARGSVALNQLQTQTSTLAFNLKSAVDAKVAQTLSDGKKQVATVRSQADAKATAIYTEAYQKNPSFYEFYMDLKAYQQLFKARPPVMVLTTDSPYLKAMHP